MKRPLAVFGLTLFFTTAVVALFQHVQAILAVSAAAFILLVISLVWKKSRRSAVLPTVFVSVLAGCLLLLCALTFSVQPALSAQGKAVAVSAVADTYPETASNPNRRYVTAKLSVNGVALPGKVRISLPAKETKLCDCTFDVEPGDTLTFVGTVYEIAKGDRGIQRSFFCRRVFLGAYPTQTVTLKKGGAPLRYFFVRAREWVSRRLAAHLPSNAAGLAASVLIGNKRLLPDGVYNDFKNAGIAHIMAVSGLHLSIWVFFFMHVFARRRTQKRVAAALLLGFVLFVMAMALFSGSVLRAGLMLGIYLLGFLLRRQADPLNSLGAAVLFILLCNPLFCMNVGFLLSVLSTLAILVFALPLARRPERVLDRRLPFKPLKTALTAVITTVLISVCVSIVTLPVQVASFGTVSMVSVLANLLLLPVMTPLLVCSGLFVALAAVPVLGPAVGWLLQLLTRYCLWAARFCSHLPGAVLTVPKELQFYALGFTACACGLLALLLWALQRKDVTKRLHIL